MSCDPSDSMQWWGTCHDVDFDHGMPRGEFLPEVALSEYVERVMEGWRLADGEPDVRSAFFAFQMRVPRASRHATHFLRPTARVFVTLATSFFGR